MCLYLQQSRRIGKTERTFSDPPGSTSGSWTPSRHRLFPTAGAHRFTLDKPSSLRVDMGNASSSRFVRSMQPAPPRLMMGLRAKPVLRFGGMPVCIAPSLP